jgi:sulfonate transport system substrate-binding protein
VNGRAWAIVLGLFLAAALQSCGSSGSDDNDHADGGSHRTMLRVGQLRSNLQPMLKAAGVLGSDMPYEISWANFEAGPQAIEAENAGAVDLAYMADTPPIFAQAAKVDVRIVGLTRALHGARYVSLVVTNGSGIDRVEDLRGKRVATVPGTITQYLLMQTLQEAGLQLDDVDQVSLQAPETVSALERGDIDAGVLVDPSAATALDRGGVRVLVTGEHLVSGSNTFVARTPALHDPDVEAAIGDFLQRVKRALEWTVTHKADWAVVYGNLNKLPPAVAAQTVDRTATRMVPIDGQALDAQQRQADAFAGIGLLPSPLSVDSEFDDRYNDLLFPR